MLHEELSYKLIGIFYKVHTVLGCGFPEKVYHKAIIIELEKEEIKYVSEKQVKVKYEGRDAGIFRLDLIVEEKIIVEIKAVEFMPKIFKKQIVSYLKAAPYEVGLLANFGNVKMEYQRISRKN